MKRLYIYIMYACAMCAPALAQNAYQEVLSAVEANSPRLNALRLESEAQQAEARQECVLENPEVEFAYLWGDPSSIGHRWDLGVSQSFDFPTTYLHRSQVKRLAIESAHLQYAAAKQEVMLQAKQLCVELAYNDSLIGMLQNQVKMAEKLLECERTRLNEQAATIIEYNLAQRQLQQSRSELHTLLAQHDAQVMELQALAGENISARLTLADLPLYGHLSSFNDWWEQTALQAPLMRYVQNEIELTEKQQRVAKDGWLPGLRIGYMSENTNEDTWRGLKVGVTLPVWGNRHKVKASQLRHEAAQNEAIAQKQAFMARLKGLFVKAQSQQQQASEIRSLIDEQQMPALLQKQYNEGAITLPAYLSGMIEQLELQKNLLSVEREACLMWTELHSIE
ncbi:MAG: TolC family protein [Bacteroidales bacterium]|nr:TolC family protein [Bacteroidales bacterium]